MTTMCTLREPLFRLQLTLRAGQLGIVYITEDEEEGLLTDQMGIRATAAANVAVMWENGSLAVEHSPLAGEYREDSGQWR